MFLVIIYPLLACRDISVDKLGVTKGDKSRRSVLQIVLTCDRGWIMLPQTKYDSHIFGHTHYHTYTQITMPTQMTFIGPFYLKKDNVHKYKGCDIRFQI